MFSQKILKIILVFSIIGFSLNTNLVPQGDFYFNPARDWQATRSHAAYWHDYAKVQHEQQCITEALYYEARGEGEIGMRYVLSVIHNRKNSVGFPNSYCKVIHQRRQFSYRNGVSPGIHIEIKPIRASDKIAYELASELAESAAWGRIDPSVDSIRGATYYHTTKVKPYWSKKMQKIITIGNHVFYRKKKDDNL